MPRSLFVASVLTASLVLACGDAGPTAIQEPPLVEALRERGFRVQIAGDPTLPLLTGVGTLLRVEEEGINVFVYADAASAAREAGWFSADASGITTENGAALILWVATPHLFLKENLLALYVGDTDPLLAALVDLLGPQIAGR